MIKTHFLCSLKSRIGYKNIYNICICFYIVCFEIKKTGFNKTIKVYLQFCFQWISKYICTEAIHIKYTF